MTHIDSIIQAIQKLGKGNVCVDQQGRLLIKSSSHFYRYPKSELLFQQFNSSTVNENQIHQGLLHPEDRIPRKSISIWLDELLLKVNRLYQSDDQSHQFADDLAVVFNMSSLIHCLMGEIDLAREICNKQMDLFISSARENNRLLRYCIQPWINLGRIDRIMGRWEDSINKFNLLEFQNEKTSIIHLGSHRIDKKQILNSIEYDDVLMKVINTCMVLEPIKTYLQTYQYQKINDIAKKIIMKDKKMLLGIVYEATIIAHLKLGNIREAFILNEDALDIISPELLHVFHFRMAELFAICGDVKARSIFKKLIDYLEYCETNRVDIQLAVFATKIANQMQRLGYSGLAYEAFRVALPMAEKIEDELIKIECLEGLISITHDDQYISALQKIIDQTGFIAVIMRYRRSINKDNQMIRKPMREKAENLFNSLMSIHQIRKSFNAK